MKEKSLKANAILNLTRTLLNILFPLITFKYASQILLSNNMGKINFSSSIISYFVLIADFGIMTYASREGAKYRRNKKQFSYFANEMFSLNVITTFIAYFLLILLICFWSKLESYKGVLLIQSISLIFTVIGATWINTIYEDYKSILFRSIMVQIASFILLFIFIHNEDDYYKYALVSVVASSGANIINAFYIRRYCRFKFRITSHLIKHIFSLITIFGISLTTTLYVNSDITMIGMFQGDVQVAYYSVAVKIYSCIKAILAAIIIVEVPKLTEMFYQKNISKYKKLSVNSLNTLITFCIPMIFGLILLSKEAVIMVSGVQYLDSINSLRILCIAIYFAVLATYITDVIILPQGLERGALIASITGAFINICLNLWFIPNYGYTGAAVTTLISEISVCFILIIYVTKRNKKNRVLIMNKSIIKNLMKSILSSIIFCIIGLIIMNFIENDILRIFCVVSISVFTYFLSMLLMRSYIVLDVIVKIKTTFNQILSKGDK